MNIPDQLQYTNIKPKGWYTRFKQWPVQPLSSNTYWNPNQIIRFLITLNSGVMDPYRSHLIFKVSMPSQTKVGGLQVDNSAQSFISQMVVSSNNVQRQRITQYDTLAAYLTDIGFSQVVCQNRQWQGLGYSNYQTGLMNVKRTQDPYSATRTFGSASVDYKGGVNPTKYNMGSSGTAVANLNQITGIGGNTVFSQNNILAMGPSSQTQDAACLSQNGMVSALRAQYNQQIQLRDYVDSTTSYLTSSPMLNPGTLSSVSVRAGTQVNPGVNPYTISYRPNLTANYMFNGTAITSTVPNIGKMWGYNRLVNSKLSTGCCQPMISNTIPQCQFGYGLTAAQPVVVPVRQFSMPLMSSICGVLMPADQYVLLPLRVLYNLLIQLTLSQYAMFTTGYNDYHQFDTYGSTTMQLRNWKISQFYYNLHIYQFQDQQIQRYLDQAISKQITITGSSWMLSAQYQISSGNVLRGNWQINVSSDYLGQVVFLFVSNQYLKYSYCRKQFRLSHNIRSLQLKFNTQFYPAQPITGNAGNPVMIDTSGDNQEFLQYLLMTYNYKFVTNVPQPRINAFNFAVNGRIYDPSVRGSMYDKLMMFNGNALTAQPGYVNGDTAMGMSFIHQNRCVGRAAYVYPFQAHGHSKNFMVGVNSREARPFQVSFDVWTQNSFPTDSTMYAFTRSNVIIVYGNKGIQVLGR